MKAGKAMNGITHDWLEIVANQVQSIRFGVVQITVHEARVVQIEKTEKVRLNPIEKNETN